MKDWIASVPKRIIIYWPHGFANVLPCLTTRLAVSHGLTMVIVPLKAAWALAGCGTPDGRGYSSWKGGVDRRTQR